MVPHGHAAPSIANVPAGPAEWALLGSASWHRQHWPERGKPSEPCTADVCGSCRFCPSRSELYCYLAACRLTEAAASNSAPPALHPWDALPESEREARRAAMTARNKYAAAAIIEELCRGEIEPPARPMDAAAVILGQRVALCLPERATSDIGEIFRGRTIRTVRRKRIEAEIIGTMEAGLPADFDPARVWLKRYGLERFAAVAPPVLRIHRA
jgi:hypothetical protein